MTIDEIIDGILASEGGYINHADDRGGETNFGITRETLGNYRNIAADRVDVYSLTESEARQIYLQKYVVEPGFLDLPEQVLPVVVDAAVLHGPSRAIRMLQEAAGATRDGVLGPKSIASVKLADRRALVNTVSVIRLKFVANLVAQKPKQSQFLRGWVNRLTSFVH